MGPTEQQMGGVVASGGNDTGAGMAPGGAAGGMAGGAAGVSPSDTGDIIISSAPDKPKVSRPLILGIILGVLVLIGGSVGAVFLLNSGKNTGTQAVTKVDGTTLVTASDYKESFLLYANYILTGVASTDALPEYDPDGDYVIWDVYNNNNVAFIKVAGGYLDNFKSVYEVSDKVEDSRLVVYNYLDVFDVVRNDLLNGVDTNGLSVGEINEAYNTLGYAETDVVEKIWDVWESLNG